MSNRVNLFACFVAGLLTPDAWDVEVFVVYLKCMMDVATSGTTSDVTTSVLFGTEEFCGLFDYMKAKNGEIFFLENKTKILH